MIKNGVVRTTCSLCYSCCGVLAHVEDGRVTRVEGDPGAPLNKGRLCSKGLASVDYAYHPERLIHPLRRAGERGEGKWERISWDEAFETIATEMNRAKDGYGAESVLFLRGAAKGVQDNVFTRLANAFGSPNITSMAFVCHFPRVNALNITFGSHLLPDFEHPPACGLLWGSNVEDTFLPTYRQVAEALQKGMKLIVVDPRETKLAKRAAFWIRPKPGSDLALALGFANVLINEDLFDKQFVADWTVGFDQLRQHVQDYSPERVEKMTWVPAEIIKEAARCYAANRPGAVQVGNALDQTVDAFQAQRAIYILESIAGNVGVPGGEVAWTSPPLVSRGAPAFTLQERVTQEKRDRRLGANYMAPFAKYALPQSVIRTLLEELPGRPRAAYIQGGNLFTTWPNARETVAAFKKLDFIAAADLFMTPTAEMSDVVLPVATYLEFDGISHSPDYYYVAQVQQKVMELGECRSDTAILIELSKHLGLGEAFWKDEHEFTERLLEQAGLTFEEFRKAGALSGVKQYGHYRAGGFKTPSGKIELYSSNLEKWGFDPLPIHRANTGESEVPEEYPLVLTNWKPGVFRHSNLRQVARLRADHPEPLVDINSETARTLGIGNGEWVYIETRRGRIRHRAKLADSLDPRVVIIEHGWWYPEQSAENLHGWAESNANVLTDNRPPFSPEMGSPTFRGIRCKVYKG